MGADPMRDETHTGLVGRWFHSWVPLEGGDEDRHATIRGNRKLQWQGQIVDRAGSLYIVELYSWWDGCANGQRAVPESQIVEEFTLYPSAEGMQIALGCPESSGRDTDYRACGNPITHVIRDSSLGPIYRCWRCIKFYSGTVEEL
jgi:hypothetical protein